MEGGETIKTSKLRVKPIARQKTDCGGNEGRGERTRFGSHSKKSADGWGKESASSVKHRKGKSKRAGLPYGKIRNKSRQRRYPISCHGKRRQRRLTEDGYPNWKEEGTERIVHGTEREEREKSTSKVGNA